MSGGARRFFGLDQEFADPDVSAAAIIPFPFEGGVSYGAGAERGPQAVLDASCEVELYDELLRCEPFRMGIATTPQEEVPRDVRGAREVLYRRMSALLDRDRFVVVVGGDHSISPAACRAAAERFESISVVQLDAHADLRHSYDGSPDSHACVMARIRELTGHTLQLGIRSMSAEEAKLITNEHLAVYGVRAMRSDPSAVHAAIAALPDPVYLTIDVDVFDWSVIAATGTPEPGGLLWDEAMDLLEVLFRERRVVAADVVELSPREGDLNSPFAVARLVYRLLGLKLQSFFQRTGGEFPDAPSGASIL